MKPFLTLDETSIDAQLLTSSRDGYSLREAARAVVVDDNNAIALLHVTRDHYYKLPGGGIEGDEDASEALERELLEEIGTTAEIVANLGTVQEYRYYWNMNQISYCYLAKQYGKKGAPNYTEEELNEGFEIVWAKNIDEAITLLESSKDVIYDDSDIARNVTFMRLRDAAIAKKAQPLIS
jgi:ADP-ribose pyrophosphatase YjhB (NUDIX family)